MMQPYQHTVDYGTIQQASWATEVATNGSNEKGSWVEIVVSTEYDIAWLCPQLVGRDGRRSILLDIAVGAQGSEHIILPDLCYLSISSNESSSPYMLPVSIPRGSRIAARIASHDSSLSLLHLNAIAGQGVPAPIVQYGAITDSRGVEVTRPSADVHGDWVEITPATLYDHNHLTLYVATPSTLAVGGRYFFDIGIGAQGSELELVKDIMTTTSWYSDTFTGGTVFSWPLSIPRGTRLSVRQHNPNTNQGQSSVYVFMYGAG